MWAWRCNFRHKIVQDTQDTFVDKSIHHIFFLGCLVALHPFEILHEVLHRDIQQYDLWANTELLHLLPAIYFLRVYSLLPSKMFALLDQNVVSILRYSKS